MKLRLLTALFILTGTLANAQDITGIWRGYFNSGYGIFKQQYKYEVQINQLGNNANQKGIEGVTYSYHSTSFYGKATLQGIYDAKNKSLTLKELKLVELKIADQSQPCLMTCYLDYSKDDKTEILEGSFISIVEKTKGDCGSGYVYLERVKESDFEKEDFLIKKEKKDVPQKEAVPKIVKQPVSDVKYKEKIKVLQTALGVTPDGIAGPKTQSILKTKVPDYQGILRAGDTAQINDLITQIKSNKVLQPKKTITPPVAKKTNPVTPQKNNGNTITKNNPDKKSLPVKGKDTIAKSKPVIPPVEPPGQKEITKKIVPVPDVIKQRDNPLVKTIVTNSPDILIQLYDNGEIDGDTITVYDNNEVIAYKKGLTGKPVTLNIKADLINAHHEFVMVANNLGAIAPNTALMIITTGGKRYELFISSDETKNAKVVIDYKMDSKELK